MSGFTAGGAFNPNPSSSPFASLQSSSVASSAPGNASSGPGKPGIKARGRGKKTAKIGRGGAKGIALRVKTRIDTDGDAAMGGVARANAGKGMKKKKKGKGKGNQANMKLKVGTFAGKKKDKALKEAIKTTQHQYYEQIKAVLPARYNMQAKTLNLSGLIADPSSNLATVPGGFSNHSLVSSCLDVIKKECKGLVALDLSNNNITTLQPWRSLGNVAPSLTALSFENNNIKSVEELQALRSIKNLNLLVLTGNQFITKFPTRQEYEGKLVRLFSTLSTLDGIQVTAKAAPRKADDNLKHVKSILLPPERSNVAPSDEVRAGIRTFLEKFLGVYDAGPRDALGEAYADDAQLDVVIPSVGSGRSSVKAYLPANVKSKSHKYTKKGRGHIVSLLKTFPATKHVPETIALFVRRVNDASISMVISGRFQEQPPGGSGNPLVRAYRREFTLVPTQPSSAPALAGWVAQVRREKWQITDDPSEGQYQPGQDAPAQLPQRQQQPAATTVTAAAPAAPAVPAAQSAAVPAMGQIPAPDPQLVANLQKECPEAITIEQATSLAQLMQATKMNAVYSLMCIKQNAWNLAMALQDFATLQASGKLGPEAF